MYLLDPEHAELGIKIRGKEAGIEIKGLVSRSSSDMILGNWCLRPEIWTKWNTRAMAIRNLDLFVLRKQRSLRKFVISVSGMAEVHPRQAQVRDPSHTNGCTVELTQLTAPSGASFTTFGLEAFGSLSQVERNLASTVNLLNDTGALAMSGGDDMSYPAWIASQGLREK